MKVTNELIPLPLLLGREGGFVPLFLREGRRVS